MAAVRDGAVERFYIKNLGLGKTYPTPDVESGAKSIEIVIFFIILGIVLLGFIVLPFLLSEGLPNIADRFLTMSGFNT